MIKREDRIVEFPNRYKLTPVSEDTYDLTPVPGEITADGSDITKAVLDELLAASGRTAGTAAALTLEQPSFTLFDGAVVRFKLHMILGENATLNINGTGAKPLQSVWSGVPVISGIPADVWYTVVYSQSRDAYIMQTDLTAIKATTTTEIKTASGTWVMPEGVLGNSVNVLLFGGGGGRGLAPSAQGGGGGGGGGGYMQSGTIQLTPGQSVPITIGTAGSTGNTGGTTSFGTYLSANGGQSGKQGATLAAGGRGGDGGNGGTGGGGGGGANVNYYGSPAFTGGSGGLGTYGGKGGNGGSTNIQPTRGSDSSYGGLGGSGGLNSESSSGSGNAGAGGSGGGGGGYNNNGLNGENGYSISQSDDTPVAYGGGGAGGGGYGSSNYARGGTGYRGNGSGGGNAYAGVIIITYSKMSVG